MKKQPIEYTEKDFEVFEREGDRFTVCPECGKDVKLNGPGSDQTILARVAKWFAWVLTWEAQDLFTTPAADVHDLQGHMGISSDEENLIVAKAYRKRCYSAIREKYEPKVEGLEARRAGRGFWVRAYYDRKIRKLRRRWKDLELIAEGHFAILKEWGGDYMIRLHCSIRG